MSGITPLTKVGAYSAAKAAVANFTRWLAVHFSRTGVRVNALAPGFFMTEQLKFLHIDERTGEYTPRARKVVAHTPLMRYGEPEELLGTMIWLLSDASKFVTGERGSCRWRLLGVHHLGRRGAPRHLRRIDPMNSPYTPPVEMPDRPIHKVLEGQKALVTGASKGLGEGVAIALAKAGADVLVNYYSDRAGAERVVKEIEKTGTRAFLFKADVAKEPEVLAMFAFMKEKLGRIDILVNNSGIQMNASFDQMTIQQWERVIGINLTGQFLCAREAVRAFKRQGIDRKISSAMGKIIFMSSVHDVIPWAGHVNYAAAKGGIMMLMKSAGQELAPLKIRMNSLSPAPCAHR